MSNLYPKWAGEVFNNYASAPAIPNHCKWWNAAIPFRLLAVSSAQSYDAADEFLSDIPSGNRVTAGVLITGRDWGGSVTANTIEVVPGYSYEAAALRFAAVTLAPPTGTVAAFVIYHDTGTESTSRLVAWIDGLAGGIAGLPWVPNGQSIVVDPGANGAVRLFSGKTLVSYHAIRRLTGQTGFVSSATRGIALFEAVSAATAPLTTTDSLSGRTANWEAVSPASPPNSYSEGLGAVTISPRLRDLGAVPLMGALTFGAALATSFAVVLFPISGAGVGDDQILYYGSTFARLGVPP